MKTRVVLTCAVCVILAGIPVTEAQSSEAGEPEGSLELLVVVVASDLSLKPVPKRAFIISQPPAAEFSISVSTDFKGRAVLDLPKGTYRVRSKTPLEFEDKKYAWDTRVVVAPGAVTTLELSNDNALIEVTTEAAPRIQLDEGDLYHQVKQSVFKVLSDSGHGSGFLVDQRGLIVTNHHVAGNSEYLAVKIDSQRKYPARVVVADEAHDIAVLLVNPNALSGLIPLALANDFPFEPPFSVGERVVAIGSPLATETILTSGLISKIEEGVIYSDVNINPGNSGGPLFTMRKEVVGINTFSHVSRSGPGLAGIVRIHLVKTLLDTIQSTDLESPPPVEQLAVESDFRFPADDLQKAALERTIDTDSYHIEAGKFDLQFVTPVVIAGLEVSAEKAAVKFRKKRSRKKKQSVDAYEAGQGFYEWRQYAGDYRPIVTLQAVPEMKLTGGSKFAVAMLGGNATQRYRFKADFDRMELWRGSTLVQPIHPKRSTNVINVDQGRVQMQDVGYYGNYEYPPEAFQPGESLKVKVWKQGEPEPIVKIVPEEIQRRVWYDFNLYFKALKESVQ